MKKFFVFTLILFSAITAFAQNDLDNTKLDYIDKYKDLAIEEQRRAGVPAAITLAQGIHESASGKSELAVDGNNHFGIKCKSSWTGATILHDDDRRQECFRKYSSSDDSYIDHSNFLKKNKRYEKLFWLEKTDYIGWSRGLRKAGYATNPKYATRLIELIEKYNLQEHTYAALKPIEKPQTIAQEIIPKKDKKVVVAPSVKKPVNNREYYKQTIYKGLPGFYARKGDYLLKQAMENDIRLAKLFALNDLDNTNLYDDMFIFLKKKKKKGGRKYHIVEEGESMHSISQKEAIQLKYLYIYNNLYNTDEPAVGEKIYMQDKSKRTPRLRGEAAPIIVKKEVEKKKVIEETNKDAIRITKSDKKVIIAETPKVEEKKIQTVAVVKEKVKKETPIKKLEVVTLKSDSSRWVKKGDNVITKITSSNPNIIDPIKAKRVEKLLNDGKSEIDIKVTTIKKDDLVTPKKVEAKKEPLTEEIVTKKETVAKKKKEVVKKKEREYNEKNVGNDVKDLKKKFDSIIYKGDE